MRERRPCGKDWRSRSNPALSKHIFRSVRRKRWQRSRTRGQRSRRWLSSGPNRLVKKHVILHASTHRSQLPPLIQRENLSQLQVHQRVLPLKLSPGAQHCVDLAIDLALVRDVCIEQRLQFKILLLHLCAHFNELHAMVEESLIELADLGLAQLQLLGGFGILPPLSHFAVVHHGHAPMLVSTHCRTGWHGRSGGRALPICSYG